MRKVLLYLIVLSQITFAQTGSYFITNYSPGQMGNAGDQNRGVTQDRDGRIYVANLNGIILNDGSSWRIIRITNDNSAISIESDKHGKVYVGSVGEFGYVDKNQKGALNYKSLSDQLPNDVKDFEYVWSVQIPDEDNVFFCSNERILWYYKNKYKTSFKPENRFHTFFTVNQILLVRDEGIGLKFLQSGKLVPVTSRLDFSNIKVRAVLNTGPNKFTIVTQENGLFTMPYIDSTRSFGSPERIFSAADDWLIKNGAYSATKINANLYVFGSNEDGIILTDEHFNIVKRINTGSGLFDNGINSIYKDLSGNIWLSLRTGLTHIEINSPITEWTKSNGIKGSVESTIKYLNRIYIATDKGVQYLDSNTNNFVGTEIKEQCFDMSVQDNRLLVATSSGLSEINNNSVSTLLTDEYGFYTLAVNTEDPNTVYLGSENGFYVYEFKNRKPELIKHIPDAGIVRSICQIGKHVLLGTAGNGVVWVDKNGNTLMMLSEKDGLPSIHSENFVFNMNGNFIIGTDDGFFEFFPEGNTKLSRSKTLNVNNNSFSISRAKEINNSIWFEGYIKNGSNEVKEIAVIEQDQTNYKLDYKMLKHIRGVNVKQFYFSDPNVYIATNLGVICYNKNYTNSTTNTFNTLISKIEYRHDSTKVHENLSPNDQTPEFTFEYSGNELHFYPSATDYIDKNELEFNWYLEGKNDSTSQWVKTNKISYSNLYEGDYTLHVRSRNILGQLGNDLVIKFKIKPPIYRTWYAYLSYIIFLAIFITLLIKFNIKRLKALNAKLEKTIKERTQTIEVQKELIVHKNKEITDSINYAKNIQSSILPPLSEIKEAWDEIFVFYQPKDIVSGDFYWFRKINKDEFLIACADCTGHGVPGGFMSMICSNKLDEASSVTTDPSEILYKVNNAVKDTLRQQSETESKNKDGMEIALIKVNTATLQITYAGANRSLWIVNQSTNELNEYKATKASIASNTSYNFSYDLNSISLNKGDMIYLTTDGYPDQFGGPEGKKFMNKNFKKFLQTINTNTVSHQEAEIRSNINSWMNNHEQVDDLLVIGIKL